MKGLARLWTLPVALAAWWVIFAWQPANFWLLMGGGTALLGTLALLLRRDGLSLRQNLAQWDFVRGLVTAAALYGVFWVGQHIVPPTQVGAIYTIQTQAPRGLITLLLLCVIGPGEELYWRGLIQHTLAERLPGWLAVLAASALYAAVHLVARNPTLVLAAFVGGLFWGGMYLRLGRLGPVIVSHALWDLAVLLLFPLQ